MKKGIAAFVAVVIVAVVLVLVLGHKKTTPEPTPSPSTNSTTPTTTTPTASTTPSANTAATSVAIKNFAFDAKTVTVKKGTTVTWTNDDTANHTVTFDDSSMSSASSGNLTNGATFSYKFDTAGTFAYHCAIHSSMTGTVVVTE